jgi:hypothetical protein
VENCTFLDRKLISALNESVDGHYLVGIDRHTGIRNAECRR